MLISAAAWGAHPLVTDDTGTQGRSNQQIEINTDRAREAGRHSQVASMIYSYGVRDELDWFVNLPFTFAPASGINDVSLGVKWRFWQSDAASVALKPEVLFPTGDESQGFGNGDFGGGLSLLATGRLQGWALHANVAISVYRYRERFVQDAANEVRWRFSAAAAYPVRANLMAVFDTGMARSADPGARQHPAFALAGFIYSPSPDLDLDIGWKAGLNAAEADHQIGVGATFRY